MRELRGSDRPHAFPESGSFAPRTESCQDRTSNWQASHLHHPQKLSQDRLRPLGASLAFSRAQALSAARAWRERRDLYPEGVASGDPQADSILEGSPAWGGGGYATLGGSDWSTFVAERAEIFDAVRDAGITGFAIVAGDRHSFWAGLPLHSSADRAQ